jgi:cyclohexanone monooxygenase
MSTRSLDVVAVGAGFGGLYALHRLRGMGLSVRVYEAGSGVGGTWFWNRYPGCRCDVESLAYSYSFSPELEGEWRWSQRYAEQPEILRYANYVADRFHLRRDIQLEARVESAHFDESVGRWRLRLSDGDRVDAQFVVMATGCLSAPNTPPFRGLDSFGGPVLHTGKWPAVEPDLSGKRVGIIGTGSSAVQSIPILAERAAHLTVFQRTPNYSIPARNAPLDAETVARVMADYPAFRKPFLGGDFGLDFDPSERSWVDASPAERQATYEARWQAGGLGIVGSFVDVFTNPEANQSVAEFIRSKIRETVHDPEVAELLCPRTHLGCKRPCADTNYFETYNRDNVKLVDIRTAPIEAVTPEGVRTGGRLYPLDVLVLATGFDAMTGALFRIDIRGRRGRELRDKWAAGPRTYLGLGTEGFPNLFTITGPGSPSVLANMVTGIEHHVDWIADCIEHLRSRGLARIEATREAEDAWVEHVNERAGRTIYTTCDSWYLGANIPGKPRVFMPYLGFPRYAAKCREVAGQGYPGFQLSP